MKQEHKDLLFKALSSYLPYKLKICYRILDLENGDPTTDNPDDRMKDCIMILDGNTLEYGTLSEKDRWYDKRNLFKPILRPLSQLNEEIEHNGERFEPLERLKCPDLGHVDYISNEREDWIKKYGHQRWLDAIPYGLIQLLLKWHFDIYGLIELGLAIELNIESN